MSRGISPPLRHYQEPRPFAEHAYFHDCHFIKRCAAGCRRLSFYSGMLLLLRRIFGHQLFRVAARALRAHIFDIHAPPRTAYIERGAIERHTPATLSTQYRHQGLRIARRALNSDAVATSFDATLLCAFLLIIFIEYLQRELID